MNPRAKSGGRLVPALVTSTSLHVAAIGLLGALPPAAQRFPGSDADRLEVRLLSALSNRIDLATVSLPPRIKPPLPSSLAAAVAVAPAPSSAASESGRRERPRPGDAPVSGGFIGHVDVGPSPSFAVIGETLQGRAVSEFPVEIEKPVQLLDKVEVPYPPPALAARIEGTVYAWVVVNPTGSVDEVEIADGPPELAVAVKEALADARFSPALDRGVPIRHYIVLEIQFHIDRQSAPVNAAR